MRLRNKHARYDKVMLDITTKCNLDCEICYRVPGSGKDIPLDKLEQISKEFQGIIISICGGEPTLRSDLPEIINMFSQNNTVFLITNGILLADYRYALKLKQNGLRYVSFSLNGFSDDTYKKINGEALLDKKLAALNNLMRLNYRIILSVLLVPGVNEKEINGLIDYAFQHRKFIKELRIRSAAPLGRFAASRKYSVEEILDILCRHKAITKRDLERSLKFKKTINSISPFNIFPIRSCFFDFYITSPENRTETPAFPFTGGLSGLLRPRAINFLYNAVKKVLFRIDTKPWAHNKNMLKIGVRSWPDETDINMYEIDRCNTGYYMDGKILPFCYANIIKEKKRLLKQEKDEKNL